jgi:hypothetical protein
MLAQGPPEPHSEATKMSNSLNIGTVLLRTAVLLPESVWVEKETYSSEWEQVTNLSVDDLDRQVRREHWSFPFIGGAIRGTCWGSWTAQCVHHALDRALRKSKAARYNGFEITGISNGRFLGLRYVTVAGHSRHLQTGIVLQKFAERTHSRPQVMAVSSSTATLPTPALIR